MDMLVVVLNDGGLDALRAVAEGEGHSLSRVAYDALEGLSQDVYLVRSVAVLEDGGQVDAYISAVPKWMGEPAPADGPPHECDVDRTVDSEGQVYGCYGCGAVYDYGAVGASTRAQAVRWPSEEAWRANKERAGA